MVSKSHFTFKKQQRNGILIFLILIALFLFIRYVTFEISSEEKIDFSSEDINEIVKELDSLKSIATSQERKSFNPNYITDYSGAQLGMSNEEIDRLLQYRKQKKWINSANEFQEITLVSDSLLNELSPYFKFPDWTTEKKSEKKSNQIEKSYDQKIDLNIATAEELQKTRGIGEVLSKRVISYRERIDGFTTDQQLYQVYGLDSTVVEQILKEFTVKTPKFIEKININTASASDIATIPGISFDLAKKIWEHRKLREQLNSINDLVKIEGMTSTKIELIQLYLSFD